MPNRRLSVRKIKEVLRLKWESGLSNRRIADSGIAGKTAVGEYVRRAEQAGLSWPLPDGMDNARLEMLLFPGLSTPSSRQYTLPDWSHIHQELKRKGVVMTILWDEYKQQHPDGLQYSRFCELYRQWRGRLDLVMRQEHRAGEKLFVDYCGQTVSITDRFTGETFQAEIFVAVLGASNYTFAEATRSQSLPDWIGSHERAFQFLGGVPELVVPDNLKSGVNKACRYDPDINPTYQDLAIHFGTAVIPARVRKPRDKAKVEAGVLLVERWILARLRNHTFFSLSDLNSMIRQLLQQLNSRPFRKLPGTRLSAFESIDRPALKPLPTQPFSYAEWKKARVNIDYHVDLDGHYYSVPYSLVKIELDIRATPRTVECFHQGKRVASHQRSPLKGRHTTLREHMPESHRRHAEWTPSRIIQWLEKSGPHVGQLASLILESRPHPEQGFRSCLGVIRLAKKYGQQRLDAACERAIVIGGPTYKSVKSILQHGLDQQPLPNSEPTTPTIKHDNVRGGGYFH